jgi:S-DNA-T family DNA segregation ATPase FtsK/SpoIIIE
VKRKKRIPIPLEFRKKFTLPTEDETPSEAAPPPGRDERLPPLELLVNEQTVRPDERTIHETAYLIEKTLAEFGIPAKVVGYRVGPTVTQYAVEPGFLEKPSTGEGEVNRQKVRVSQISALSRDLALALSAERLRIEAPVPGRPYVGIEVPNARSSVVRLRPILETEAFYRVGSPLAVALGRDVSGQPVVADLERMPHLLIAGTTGSGKSVCIAALTTCLVMNNTPQDLRLVMIDPKMVELVRFNGLPHLYGKVETDLERILGVLRWTVAEMDRRYRLLEASHSRNLDSYNRKARRRKGAEPLPRIVVLIDELADLMMSAPEQTEPLLVRLAQMARATGIHLVVATQRPSTDVVTGLIKANFPARLSFAVASSVDSRVILDAPGAETLLGHGDMLFLPPDASGPLRAQGVMVTDQEIERVITFWQKSHLQESGDAPWEEMLKQESLLAERDDLLEQAIAVVRQTQRVSTSLLQRRLRIGYPRAARLMDELEQMGIIGPAQSGGREREVLLKGDPDDEHYRAEG